MKVNVAIDIEDMPEKKEFMADNGFTFIEDLNDGKGGYSEDAEDAWVDFLSEAHSEPVNHEHWS